MLPNLQSLHCYAAILCEPFYQASFRIWPERKSRHFTEVSLTISSFCNKPYKLTDGGGLFLLVKLNGSELWQHKYQHLGKERLLSHGQYPDVTLAQARQKLHDGPVAL